MDSPKPGKPVRGSSTGRPIMALLDLMGRRTSLRILWELRGKPLKFRPLQDAAATSPSVLNTRLKELKQACLITHSPEGYILSDLGRELADHIVPLSKWADHWATYLSDGENKENPAG